MQHEPASILIASKCTCEHLRHTIVHVYYQMQFTEKLKKCGACKFCRYCSRACQISDWRRAHRGECNAIQQAYPSGARRQGRQVYYGVLDEVTYDLWMTILRRWVDPEDPFQRFMRAAEPFMVGDTIVRENGGASSSR